MTIVRLYRSRYSPKDATGSKLYGGRWNSPGREVLYASSTLALACLEVLVHVRDVGLMPTDYVFCEIEVPKELIGSWTLTGEEALAKIESPVLSREFGDMWFRRSLPAVIEGRHRAEAVAPVQAVPPVIITREMNYLLSPVHPDFSQLTWSKPRPFRFDPRLMAAAE